MAHQRQPYRPDCPMRASWPSKYFADQTTWRHGSAQPSANVVALTAAWPAKIDSLVLARQRANSSSLTLGEDPNQRPPRWYLRTKIANKSCLGSNLHMTSRSIGAVDQHRS